MEYKILEADKLERLVQEVNDHIAEGWRPQGGIAMGFNTYLNEDASYNPDITWAQAMIIDKDDGDVSGGYASGGREPRW